MTPRSLFLSTCALLAILPCSSQNAQPSKKAVQTPDDQYTVSVPIAFNLNCWGQEDDIIHDSLLLDPYSILRSPFTMAEKESYYNLIISGVLNKTLTKNLTPFDLTYKHGLYDPILKPEDKSEIPETGLSIIDKEGQDFYFINDGSFFSMGVTCLKDHKLTISPVGPQIDFYPTIYKTEKPAALPEGSVDYTITTHGLSLAFAETWSFNTNTHNFEKLITYQGLNAMAFTKSGSIKERRNLLLLESKTGGTDWKLFRKNVVYDVCISRDPLSFSQQKTIDNLLNEGYEGIRNPSVWNNISSPERARFLHFLTAYCFSGHADAFSITGGTTEAPEIDFSKKASLIDFQKIFEVSDTVFTPGNPSDPSSPLVITPIIYSKSLGDIWGIRFYEDWYFDEKTASIKKEVKGITLLLNVRGPNGQIMPWRQETGIYIRFKE
jgi:hypothetical protein